MTTRRDFLKASMLASGVVAAREALFASPARDDGGAAAPMSILILGGTGFIGPHLVRYAMSRGHKITIFTRGRRDGDLPDGVTRLVGDRNGQLGSLVGGKWDAVIDDSATNPDWVKQSADALKNSTGRYLFTSSTGVYYPYLTPKADESIQPHSNTIDAKDQDEAYGVNKTKCELEVMRVFGDRGLVVRPTYIVGPGDTSDRFPYWAARMPLGGDVLAPGRKDDPVEWIDVRDLTAFYIKLIEDRKGGAFNGVSAATTIPSRDFYETVRKTLNPKATMVYVDDYELLGKNGLEEIVPWVRLTGNNLHATSVASSKSAAAGLKTRTLVETLRDTAAWWPTVPEARRTKPKFAMTPEIEAKVLAAWKGRGKSIA
jgi:2'-hydroxyisoflavone reductase